MTILFTLVSVGTLAFNPPSVSACEIGGARIRSSAAASVQPCRVGGQRRVKACKARGCGGD